MRARLKAALESSSLSSVLEPMRVAHALISCSALRGRLRAPFCAALLLCSMGYYAKLRAREPCIKSCLAKHFFTVVTVLSTLALPFYCRLAAGSLHLARRLHTIDLALNQLGYHFTYSHRYLMVMVVKSLLFLAEFLTGVTVYTTRTDLSYPAFFLYRLTQFHPLLVTIFLLRPFMMVIHMIGGHFELITSAVSSINLDSQCQAQRDEAEKQLAGLVLVHHQLAALSADLEAIGGRPMLVFFAMVFINTIGSLYFLVNQVLSILLNPSLFSVGIILSAVWCLQWCSLLLEIVLPCHNCQFKANEFTNSLFNKMIENESSGLLNNEKLKLHLSMKREVQFTACGVFPLDNTLIHSMISAATTYLIILVQFNPNS